MATTRWTPVGQLANLQSDMARMMNAAFGNSAWPANGGETGTWLPAVDVNETEDALVLSFDLPGLKQDQIELELDDNVLTVSGKRERKHERKGDDYYRYERRFGAFSRSVALPAGVKDEDVSAEYEDGVLEVRIAKPEQHKPKRIQVGGGSSAAIEGTGTRKD